MKYLYIIQRPDDPFTITVYNSVRPLDNVSNIKFALLHDQEDPIGVIHKFLISYPLVFIPQAVITRDPDIIESRSYTIHKTFPINELFVTLSRLQFETLARMNTKLEKLIEENKTLKEGIALLEKRIIQEIRGIRDINNLCMVNNKEMAERVEQLEGSIIDVKSHTELLDKKVESRGTILINPDHFSCDSETEMVDVGDDAGDDVMDVAEGVTEEGDRLHAQSNSIWQSIFSRR